jgi:hypothetical protein
MAPSGRVEDVIQARDGSYLSVGAIGWNGAIWRSTDGMHWIEVPDVPAVDPKNAKGLSGVVQTANGFLAWGGGGLRYSEGGFSLIWTSRDGRHWGERAVWTGFLLDVAVGGPGFVGVGSMAGLDNLYGALAWSSIDGTTWANSPQVPGVGGTGMLDLVPFQGGLLAVGATRGPGGWIRGLAWKSQDGVHWAQISNDADLDAGLSRVLVSGGRLIAAGSITVDPNRGLQRPVIRVSADGATWTQTFARDCCGEMMDIVDTGHELLAVYRWYLPEGARSGAALLRSVDGEHWVEIGAPQLDAGVSWIRLLHVGGSLGVVGLGIRDLGNATYQPLLLIPPAALNSH